MTPEEITMHRLAFSLAFALAASTAFAADPLPRAKPETVGMSSAALARIGETIEADVQKGRLPGAVIAVARKAKLVYYQAFGWLDKDAGTKMTTDAIFSIASMTKPIVAAGALELYEQGLVQIDDPVSNYLPQFAKMQVAVLRANDGGAPGFDTVPAAPPVTIQDLMRHTSGIVYGGRGAAPAAHTHPPAPRPPGAHKTRPGNIAKRPLRPPPHTP